VIRVSLKPLWSLAYSSAISCIVLMTAPLAARDNSHEISRGLISPSGLIWTGFNEVALLPPHAARAGDAAAARARARNWDRLIFMVSFSFERSASQERE